MKMGLYGFNKNEEHPNELSLLVAVDEYINYLAHLGFRKGYITEDILRMALVALYEINGDVSAQNVIYLITHCRVKKGNFEEVRNVFVRNYWDNVYNPLYLESNVMVLAEVFCYVIETGEDAIEEEDLGSEKVIKAMVEFLIVKKKYKEWIKKNQHKLAADVYQQMKKHQIRVLLSVNWDGDEKK